MIRISLRNAMFFILVVVVAVVYFIMILVVFVPPSDLKIAKASAVEKCSNHIKEGEIIDDLGRKILIKPSIELANGTAKCVYELYRKLGRFYGSVNVSDSSSWVNFSAYNSAEEILYS
mgnify:CR=1 FL=1